VDFEAEGLLDGLQGDEREARRDLLEQLSEAGVGDDELKRAVSEDRLALLPVERALGGRGELTARDVAERADVPLALIHRDRRALGLPAVDDDDRVFAEEDVEALHDLKQILDSGLDEEGVEEVTRVLGESMSRVARAVAHLTATSLLRPGDTERDLGLRFAEAAEHLGPLMGKQLQYVFNLHLREIVRSEVVSRAERASGELPGSETVNVAFADLVGFTKLGEGLPPEEIGQVAGRLGRLAAEVAEPPVRLVKTIGDAAMLVSPDAPALVRVTLDLVKAADEEGEDFPQLRGGVARGEAIGRGGDWYGRPVNVASRVTGVARPGSVLTTEGVQEAAEDDFSWSFAGRRRLKGVKEPLPLYRVRSPEADAGEK
jgi:adenylate cyclase